jgi:kynureninase
MISRDAFQLPAGLVYLDGHSLGPLSHAAAARMQAAIQKEWGTQLIRGWTQSDWISLPGKVGDKIGKLIGAARGATICADSTSVNLYKVLAAALTLRPGRTDIVSTIDNFPTDLYIAQGLISQLKHGHRLKLVDAHDLDKAMDNNTAAVMLTHVNYKDASLFDIAALTARAHKSGALAVWDLSHSAGVLPLQMDTWQVDFAVGCGYKYLNGGPGAPGYVMVAPRHQENFSQPLSGWMGHAQPFAFDSEYRAADGIDRYLAGTPPVLSMTALDAALDITLTTSIQTIRSASMALSDAFIRNVAGATEDAELALASPRDAASRGSHVSYRHSQGYAIVQALAERGVIGDFRAPDLIRFGFNPLYNTLDDARRAAQVLADVLSTRAWDQPEFQHRNRVT